MWAVSRNVRSAIEFDIAFRDGCALCGHLVLHSNALTTLPRRLAHILAADLGLAVAATPIALPTVELSMYWHERSHRDPACQWFRHWVRGILSSPLPVDPP